MDRIIKIVGAILLVVVIGAILLVNNPFVQPDKVPVTVQQTIAPGSVQPSAVQNYTGPLTVYFLYGEECPHCHVVRPFIDNMSAKYPNVNFQFLETWHNATNANIANTLNDNLGVPEKNRGVPEVIVSGNGTPLIGDRDIPGQLEGAILAGLKKNQ
jgi:hypothetical protein